MVLKSAPQRQATRTQHDLRIVLALLVYTQGLCATLLTASVLGVNSDTRSRQLDRNHPLQQAGGRLQSRSPLQFFWVKPKHAHCNKNITLDSVTKYSRTSLFTEAGPASQA